MSDIKQVMITIDVSVRDVTSYSQALIGSDRIGIEIPLDIAFDGGTNIGYMVERMTQAIIRRELRAEHDLGAIPTIQEGE